MQEQNKTIATISWYDDKEGYGIATTEEMKLFVHKIYLDENISLTSNDIISCTPVIKNGIYHATNVKLLQKSKTLSFGSNKITNSH